MAKKKRGRVIFKTIEEVEDYYNLKKDKKFDDYYDYAVDCPFKTKCKSKGLKCESCEHNKNRKDDYYKPNPYRPWIPPVEPYEPYNPWKPGKIIWYRL